MSQRAKKGAAGAKRSSFFSARTRPNFRGTNHVRVDAPTPPGPSDADRRRVVLPPRGGGATADAARPVDETMPLRHAVFGGGGRQAPDPGHREGEDVDRTGGLRFCFSSIFREGGRRLRGSGKNLLAREFGRSQHRRSRACSDVVILTFIPSAFTPWKRHFSSKNSVRRDLLMT